MKTIPEPAGTLRVILAVATLPPPPAKPSLLDPSFVYVDAAHTDIRKTFERIRAQPVWRKHEHK